MKKKKKKEEKFSGRESEPELVVFFCRMEIKRAF